MIIKIGLSKRGDKVLIRYSKNADWKERIYLATVEGSVTPYITVNISDEEAFHNDSIFHTSLWEDMKPLPETKEVTMEEVEKMFGCKVKIIK